MKQTTLGPKIGAYNIHGACFGGLIFSCALYGLATALLWQLAGASVWARAATWAIALVSGLALLVRALEL